MAYLGTKELESILPSCIDGYDKDRIDNVAYELGLGAEAYLTDSKNGKKEILDKNNPQIVIKPGQFALLLTEESVKIPTNILAFISIKFSQKIKGLINVSGFHVDPGFEGKIIFSVYNAGPAPIVLDKGAPYFLMWFSNLTDESEPYNGKHKGQQGISAESINSLNGELASPNTLLERIRNNESKLTNFSWAAGVLMTIGIGMFITSYSDNLKFEEGYSPRYMEEQIQKSIDEKISKSNIESVINYKIDSILNLKIKDDASNK